jgi:hypothetical protein
LTEGFARDFASYGTVDVEGRSSAACVSRRRGWPRPSPGGTWGRARLAAVLAAALATVTLWPSVPGGSGPPAAARAGGPLGLSRAAALSAARLKRLPIEAQALISTALGAARSASAARPTRSGYTLAGGGVGAQLGRDTVWLAGDGGAVSLALQAVGRRQGMHPVAAVPPAARANRVVYRHGNLTEWYAAGPLGLEQGFTVQRRPAGLGQLVLAIGVGGSLTARRAGSGLVFMTRSGVVALRYRGLVAVDAAGRRLRATLALQRGRFLIRVSDRRARYPVTIDPLIQQGVKLTGAGATFPYQSALGANLALSQDGSTVLVGGTGQTPAGAAWVFTDVGGVWAQQGGMLAPNNAVGNADFGDSVALSADGDVALIGGFTDGENSGSPIPQGGAAWIFYRDSGTWSQGPKFMPSNAIISPNDHGSFFGRSVALSDDGTTAVIGGWADNNYNGAAWVFSDTSSGWTQITKLSAPTGETASGQFAQSVALSGDGKTALMTSVSMGAAWVYTDTTGTWTEQGGKLTPSDETGGGQFGSSAALSENGNTALIGGPGDGGGGAAWVFTRSGATWSQQGPKLTPSDEANAPTPGGFGTSVALSADGSTALVGGPYDFNNAGAAWLFVRSGTTWSQRGPKVTVNTVTGDEQGQGEFGNGVGLSGDGIRALIGGPNDNGFDGAVWAFNQVPACANVSATAPPGGGAVALSLSCTGPEGQPITYAVATGPGHGGVGSINQSTGAITYVSQPGFIGTDSFTYVASDAGGTSLAATVTVTVPPAPPTCAAASASTAAGGGAVSIKLPCAAPAGVGIQYGIVSAPAHGTLSALNQSAGSVVYTPSPGFHGVDSFTYDASDSGGASTPATATVAVPPGPPVCADIASSTAGEGSSITVQLSCTGPAGVGMSYAIVSRPAHGTLGAINQARHTVRYTPRAGYNGRDRFTYTATDPGGTSNRGTATIIVPRPAGTLAFALLSWSFNPSGNSAQVTSMTASGVPVGTKIIATCQGHGCRLKASPLTVTSATTCHSKQHRCKHKSGPNARSVDLTSALRSARFPVGSRLTVSFTKRGFIGKAYIFTMQSNRQPAWKATCLAPGSLVPGKGC